MQELKLITTAVRIVSKIFNENTHTVQNPQQIKSVRSYFKCYLETSVMF